MAVTSTATPRAPVSPMTAAPSRSPSPPTQDRPEQGPVDVDAVLDTALCEK
ncbi:hypothetical protein ACTPOK_35960 [Streptomyces inhibens]|uniref:hypothetical protein n=1 Tax=Streptomyces inhibens TaxID=2293571 RepID=UPI00402A7F49